MLGIGIIGFLPQRNSRVVSWRAALADVRLAKSASAASRLQSGPDSFRAHGTSIGAATNIVFSSARVLSAYSILIFIEAFFSA